MEGTAEEKRGFYAGQMHKEKGSEGRLTLGPFFRTSTVKIFLIFPKNPIESSATE
jgi:hypothetical protein